MDVIIDEAFAGVELAACLSIDKELLFLDMLQYSV
jgi:hypothetical protein